MLIPWYTGTLVLLLCGSQHLGSLVRQDAYLGSAQANLSG